MSKRGSADIPNSPMTLQQERDWWKEGSLRKEERVKKLEEALRAIREEAINHEDNIIARMAKNVLEGKELYHWDPDDSI